VVEGRSESAARELAAVEIGDHVIVGVGGLALKGFEGGSIEMPHTPTDLFIRISGADPGQVLHRARALLKDLPSFEVVDRVAGFAYADSRDLTGFVDGTENPTGTHALEVAFQPDGSSIAVVQRWAHDLDAFSARTPPEQNRAIGRDKETNEELEDAPPTAHIKRTEQESFDPEAFLLRRSMPWRDHRGMGLVFLSFSATLDPFSAQLRRMVGAEDGLVDGLFAFTTPVTGAVYRCPPIRRGRLVLS